MADLRALKDVAKVIRSKNAGPFEVTFDIIFDDRSAYERVKAAGIVTPELIGRIYGLPVASILTFAFFDLANAIKITIPRGRPQGSIGETDMHAAQQHAPLMEIRVPWPGAPEQGKDLT